MTRLLPALLGLALLAALLAAAAIGYVDHAVASVEIGGLGR